MADGLQCTPYPASSEAGTAPSTPLKHRMPGNIFPIAIEDFFDAIFRNFGERTFMEAYRAARNTELAQLPPVASWLPEPPAGSACTATLTDPPSRAVRVRRPVQVAAWMRMALQMPESCECAEQWTLFGLGQGVGFIVQISIEFSGPFVSDSILLYVRYKAAALDARSTQVDLEAEVEWRQPRPLMQTKLEQAVIEEVQRGFEMTFLPLVAQTLAAEEDASSASRRVGLAGSPPVINLEAVDESTDPNLPISPSAIPISTIQDFTGPISPSAQSQIPLLDRSHTMGSMCPQIEAEYNLDWITNAASNYELRVEVIAAWDMQSPEYRLGDITTRFFQGEEALLSNLYVHLILGKRDAKTQPNKIGHEERCVTFQRERFLFPYSGETELKVEMRDQRGIQALIRGDPLIGEGTLCLGPDLVDMLPHWADVVLLRKGHTAGGIALRFQFVHAN